MVVKLHPAQDDKKIFRQWLEELKLSDKVLLFQKEDIFDVLTITDIAVTFHSTTGIEAIAFRIPLIILNIIKNVDVRDYITFIDDAIECKTSQEFQYIMTEMIAKPERYETEVNRTLQARGRYIKNSDTFNTSMFVRDYIMNRLS